MSAGACRPTFWSLYVTLFGALAGNLNRQRASQAAGFAAVAIAAVTLIRWWVSPPLPSSWGSGFATVTTALCLAALGLAVVYPGTASRFVFAIDLAVAAVAAVDSSIYSVSIPASIG
jgi:hypothetical protein